MVEKSGRSNSKYRRNNQRLKYALPPICAHCHQRIDLNLHFQHPMAWTSDHITPLSLGGDLYGPRVPMHRRCNAQKGNGRQGQTPPIPQHTHDTTPGRTVVLLCGPPGAGKTTQANNSGLTVYDRDDKQWANDTQFNAALKALSRNNKAQAVVIRAGANSSARNKNATLINATHTYLIMAPQSELRARVIRRGREDAIAGLAAITTWYKRHDTDDHVATFPGWANITVTTTGIRTTTEW